MARMGLLADRNKGGGASSWTRVGPGQYQNAAGKIRSGQAFNPGRQQAPMARPQGPMPMQQGGQMGMRQIAREAASQMQPSWGNQQMPQGNQWNLGRMTQMNPGLDRMRQQFQQNMSNPQQMPGWRGPQYPMPMLKNPEFTKPAFGQGGSAIAGGFTKANEYTKGY